MSDCKRGCGGVAYCGIEVFRPLPLVVLILTVSVGSASALGLVSESFQ